MRVNLLLLLRPHLLTIEQANEITAEAIELGAQVVLAKEDWPWIECRRLKPDDAAAFLDGLRARVIRFIEQQAVKRTTKRQVQVAQLATAD